MAIYHLSTKPISRSSGRSAVASIAYRAGIEIKDDRLGKTYNYTKRSGVLGETLLLPNNWKVDRAVLWNMAEKSENRKDARTAREIVINIPHELTDNGHKLAMKALGEFANHITERYGVAVDIAYHAPDKAGDERNYHAHLLLTTRQIQMHNGEITLGEKSELELSDRKLKELGKPRSKDELVNLRQVWADIANQNLERAGTNERIDHRSHKDRGLATLPTVKMGWQATELERQGVRTEVGDKNRAIRAYNAQIEHNARLQEQVRAEKHEKTAQNPLFLPKNEKLTTNQNQNTHENAQKHALEPQKNKNGSGVPPTPKNTLKTQNKAFSESPILSPEQHRQTLAFLQEFNERIQHIAKQIWQNQLKTLQDKGKTLLATFEKIRDSKPLFFGKDQWQQDKKQALDAYNTVKTNHDTIKAKGVTAEHNRQASEQLAKDDPSYHEKGKQAFLAIKLHELAKLDNLAKQYGADKHARAGQTYKGKIIQSDDKGTLQATSSGIVYHKTSRLEVGKGYTLSLDRDGKMYTIQKDYEIRTKNQQQEHDQDQDKER